MQKREWARAPSNTGTSFSSAKWRDNRDRRVGEQYIHLRDESLPILPLQVAIVLLGPTCSCISLYTSPSIPFFLRQLKEDNCWCFHIVIYIYIYFFNSSWSSVCKFFLPRASVFKEEQRRERERGTFLSDG